MWHVLYYETEGGKCPVKGFIDARTARNQAKILAMIEALEEKGPNLPRPYADLLEEGIHELRVRLSGDSIRILYFFCYRDFIVLTNVFDKRTGKVPASEINEAKRFRADFLTRYDENALRETFK